MAAARGAQKVERVTVTLHPSGDARAHLHVPSTYNQLQRSYAWRRDQNLEYMIVPTRVSGKEILVDLFVNVSRLGRTQAKELTKVLRGFVETKIDSEWKGLRLGGMSRPTVAIPPRDTIVRGAIEEILGADIER